MEAYKQTEVGEIPSDWSIESIGDICGFIVPGRNKPRHFDGEIPWITTPDLEDGRSVGASRIGLCVSRAEAQSIGSRVVPAGSVLMSCVGDLGITAITCNELVINQQLHAFIPSVQVSAVFLLNVITSQKWQLEGLATKTAVPYLNKNNCNSIRIPLPRFAEQEAIAQALSDADALIESLEQLIAKKRQIKQGAMQELLTGKRRLPGFSGGWEIKFLGDVCKITTGKKDVNEGNPDGQFPFFTCSRRHTFSDRYSFDTKAILIAGNGDVGNLHYYEGKFEAYQRTYVLLDFSENVNFLWQQLDYRLVESLGLGKIGSSIPYIKKENLMGFAFDNPQEEGEQEGIAACLKDMDSEIAALEQKLAKARRIKQGMMQQLLTGRIRLV